MEKYAKDITIRDIKDRKDPIDFIFSINNKNIANFSKMLGL